MKKIILFFSLMLSNSVFSTRFPIGEEVFWIQNFSNSYKQGSFDEFYYKFNSMINALVLKSRFLRNYNDQFVPGISDVLNEFYSENFNVEPHKCSDLIMFSKIAMSEIIETIEIHIKKFGYIKMLIKGIKNFYFSIVIDSQTTKLIQDHAKKFLKLLNICGQLCLSFEKSLTIT